MTTSSQIISHQSIYQDEDFYSAWPALVRCANGDLIVAFCRTEQHCAPHGSIVTVRSTDNGETWSDPEVVYNTLIDDRENGLTILPDGRIVMHIWSTHWKPENYLALEPDSYPAPILQRWTRYVSEPDYVAAKHLHGSWTIISEDHGHTWSEPQRGPDSVHGGIALQDGSLLIAAYRDTPGHSAIYGTPAPEQPWVKFADIKCPTPDTHRFGEPHIAQLPSGRIVVMIRYTAQAYDDTRDDLHLWQTYSDDNGHSWSPPERTPMLGFPPQLTVLSDGRLLCTYSYRRAPYGERACISPDGITWDIADEVILRDDNANHDLGYPHSIETASGEVLTVYYQKPKLDPDDKHKYKVGIFATRWRAGAS